MMVMALALATALAALAAAKHALTPGGILLAWLLCVAITYFGGTGAFVILAETFIFTVLADALAGKRADPYQVRRKSGARDAVRVFCNVGVGGAAMLLFGLTQKRVFALAYACVMAASLADSLASKLGPLSKKQPVDICTFRRVDAGLSGGVTLLGLGASLLGGLLIGTSFALFNGADYSSGAIVAAAGLAGSIIDSILGSTVQVKYVCPQCGMLTEREEHCGKPTQRCKGLRRINNDAVNFLSNVSVFVLALFLCR